MPYNNEQHQCPQAEELQKLQADYEKIYSQSSRPFNIPEIYDTTVNQWNYEKLFFTQKETLIRFLALLGEDNMATYHQVQNINVLYNRIHQFKIPKPSNPTEKAEYAKLSTLHQTLSISTTLLGQMASQRLSTIQDYLRRTQAHLEAQPTLKNQKVIRQCLEMIEQSLNSPQVESATISLAKVTLFRDALEATVAKMPALTQQRKKDMLHTLKLLMAEYEHVEKVKLNLDKEINSLSLLESASDSMEIEQQELGASHATPLENAKKQQLVILAHITNITSCFEEIQEYAQYIWENKPTPENKDFLRTCTTYRETLRQPKLLSNQHLEKELMKLYQTFRNILLVHYENLQQEKIVSIYNEMQERMDTNSIEQKKHLSGVLTVLTPEYERAQKILNSLDDLIKVIKPITINAPSPSSDPLKNQELAELTAYHQKLLKNVCGCHKELQTHIRNIKVCFEVIKSHATEILVQKSTPKNQRFLEQCNATIDQTICSSNEATIQKPRCLRV